MEKNGSAVVRIGAGCLDGLRRAWAQYAVVSGEPVRVADQSLTDRAALLLIANLRARSARIAAQKNGPPLPRPVEIERGGRATGAAVPIINDEGGAND